MNNGKKVKLWIILPMLLLLMEACVFPLTATSNEIKIKQNQPPTVSIINLEKKGIYFRNSRFLPALRILIFGYITIKATATDDIGIKQVEFYVDGELRNISTKPHSCESYMWTWNERIWIRSHHTIKVIAVDNESLTTEDTCKVIIHNFPIFHPFYP